MILGIGSDIVQVDRFNSWTDFSHERLLKVFSESELKDCLFSSSLDTKKYIPQKLASRFAAKEAFFKALSATLVSLGYTQHTFPLLFACKHISLVKTTWGVPTLKINWQAFEEKIQQNLPKISVNVSIADEHNHVVAFVTLQIL